MKKSNNYDYDVIIIGAGIGGLTCGCYLAKAGLRTLIVEKNATPGGYCTSFSRKGFKFDACAHSLGSLREKGILSVIFKELDLKEKIQITRYDPQDIIITPDGKITFWNNLDKTIASFETIFPRESKNIRSFFDFLINCNGLSFSSLRNLTFDKLLDEYFKDERLKSVLSLPVLGNAGMSGSISSAFTAVALYKEFMLDGGYYPNEAMQKLPDAVLKKFKEFGGDIMSSSFASRIKVKNNCVEGVEINERDVVSTKYVISDVDATQTFMVLVGERNITRNIKDMLKSLKPSLSILILYLGTDIKITNIPINTNMWFLPDYDTETMYRLADGGEIDKLDWFLLRLLSDRKNIIVLVNSPFKNQEYWKKNKERLIDLFIKKIESVTPGISRHIVFKDAATPNTLYKWTLNYKGAAYGWEGTPAQFAIPGLSQGTEIRNLYLTGHWATLVQGISGVARLGRDTARIIINKEKKKI